MEWKTYFKTLGKVLAWCTAGALLISAFIFVQIKKEQRRRDEHLAALRIPIDIDCDSIPRQPQGQRVRTFLVFDTSQNARCETSRFWVFMRQGPIPDGVLRVEGTIGPHDAPYPASLHDVIVLR